MAKNVETRTEPHASHTSLEVLGSWLVLSHHLVQQLEAKSCNSPSFTWLPISPSRKAEKYSVLNDDLLNTCNYMYDGLT